MARPVLRLQRGSPLKLKVEGTGRHVPLSPGGSVFNPGTTQYEGPYEVEPTYEEQVLDTDGKLMGDDVTVEPIEVYRTTNEQGGYTVVIGT